MRPHLMLLILGSVALAEVSSIEELKPIQRAHEEISQIKSNYRKALEKAVAKSGAEQAIGACRLDASKIKKAKSGNVQVGRTSLRLRNPSNRSPEWAKPILEDWAKKNPSQLPKNQLVELGPNHYGYVEPIFTEAICLNCHGAHLSPMMKKVIKASYPEDEATGFEVGQLRGVIWLESKP